jgi:hypothetical protein
MEAVDVAAVSSAETKMMQTHPALDKALLAMTFVSSGYP